MKFSLVAALAFAAALALPTERMARAAPIVLAQAADPTFRVNQLEEQMRQLTGRVEELTFQLLQIQEQLRKMQEDNEFRFQELEDQSAIDGGSDGVAVAGSAGDPTPGKPSPSDSAPATGSDGLSHEKTIEDVIAGNASGDRGEPPISLGTLTFDADGNVVGAEIGEPLDLTGRSGGGAAPVGLPDNPDELFDLGYQYVQGGSHENAIAVFERFSMDYPEHPRRPEARFWLGESYFALGRYEQAARIFLDNHKQNPQASLGAQNLLKLGVSLAGLNQRELACATYAEVPKKYPDISNAVRKRIDVEQRAAKCQTG